MSDGYTGTVVSYTLNHEQAGAFAMITDPKDFQRLGITVVGDMEHGMTVRGNGDVLASLGLLDILNPPTASEQA